MEITINKNDSKMEVAVSGRLDTITSQEFSEKLFDNLSGVDELVLDFSSLRYLSSSGLRVILSCQKKINSVKGTMVVKNVNDLIMEIFDATGFSDILTIEND